MRWISVILAAVLLVIISSPYIIVKADTTADVTLYATPIVVGGGITNFTIIYVNDQRLDFTWGYSGNVTDIMIRGKYGSYPADITSVNETPSDGYLVYSGNATTASDTSIDFDQNAGIIYYKAWGQNNDGSWVLQAPSGSQEGKIMGLIALGLIAVGMTIVGARSQYYILKVMAGFFWILVLAYWIYSPPSSVVVGGAVHSIGIVVFIGVALAMFFMPMWTTRFKDGQEIGGRFRLPFMQTDDEEEADRQRTAPTRRQRNNAYLERLNTRTRGERP